LETTVFRIVQEALTNVFRHSEAQKVWINLSLRDGAVVVSILDNGKGINQRVAELRPESVGVGIGGMKQRVREFGGELRLSNADPGTRLELVIPSNVMVRETSAVLDG
jgi:signal transduction histidine kinase